MTATSWQQGVEQQKLRLRYDVELPGGISPDLLMPTLYEGARTRRPFPDVSQDETFHFHQVTPEGEGYLLRLSVIYDYDYHAMYDQCETDQVVLFCDPTTGEARIEEWRGRRDP